MHMRIARRPQAADYIAIAVSELGSISERRIEHLVNSRLSNPTPPDDGKPRAWHSQMRMRMRMRMGDCICLFALV